MGRAAGTGVGVGHASDQTRASQVLTAQALMLALDHDLSTTAAAAELARMSKGDLETLTEVSTRVREITSQHPGPAADPTAAIVEAATERVASLQRHPSADRRGRFRLVS